MFDKISQTKNESKVVAVTQIVEKTITPDKVAEIYHQSRLQAEKDIICSMRLESNSLKGVVFQIRDRVERNTSNITTRFLLNGEEHIDTTQEHTWDALAPEKMVEKLHTHYQKVVSHLIIRHAGSAQTFCDIFKK